MSCRVTHVQNVALALLGCTTSTVEAGSKRTKKKLQKRLTTAAARAMSCCLIQPMAYRISDCIVPPKPGRPGRTSTLFPSVAANVFCADKMFDDLYGFSL
jgi:hypothetical protein